MGVSARVRLRSAVCVTRGCSVQCRGGDYLQAAQRSADVAAVLPPHLLQARGRHNSALSEAYTLKPLNDCPLVLVLAGLGRVLPR